MKATALIFSHFIFYFSSLARKAIRFCKEKDLVKPLGEHHHSQYVYTTTAVPKKADEKAEGEKQEKQPKGKGQQKKGKEKAAAAEAEKETENA